MKKLDFIGYFVCLLFGVSLFLSEKFENNVLIPLLCLLFVLSIVISKNERETFFGKIDKKFLIALVSFVLISYVIPFFDGGIETRLDNYISRLLIVLPLIFFVNEEKKIFNFLKSFLFGGMIILVMALYNFITNYNEWAHPIGFYYPRITAILTVQDFANVMCIILLFLLSFIFFYKNEDAKKNKFIKSLLIVLATLVLFIVVVNRSKMVYICLLPTISYILFKKNKKYIIGLVFICIGGYFLLPASISKRLHYIADYKKDPSSNLRVIFWKTGIEAFKEKPIYGWKASERKEFNLNYYEKSGLKQYVYDNFLSRLDKWPIYYVNTHSTYLQYLLDFGIIGFIFFMMFVVELIYIFSKIKFYKKLEKSDLKLVSLEIAVKASLVAWGIQALTDINLNNKYMTIILCTLIFILYYLYNKFVEQES